MSIKYSLLLFCLSLLARTGRADTKVPSPSIVVLTSQWEGYTNPDRTGLYFDVLNEVYGKDSYTFNYYPWKRAQTNFAQDQGDLLLGEASDKEYCLYPERPLDADFFSAFHLSGKNPKWPGVAATKGRRLGWVRGYDINVFSPGVVATNEVESLEQGAKMVLAGRLDFFIDYDQDLKDYLAKNKLETLGALVSPTDIAGDYIYLCFHKSERGQQLRDRYNQKIKALSKSGALKKIFIKYNRIKNFDKISAFKPSAKKN